MRRILSAALALFLSLLCISDIPIWLRGYWRGDTLVYRWIPNSTTLRFIQIWTAGGGLRIMLGAVTYSAESGPQLLSWEPGLHHGDYGDPKYPTETWGNGDQWGGYGFYYYRLNAGYPPTAFDAHIYRSMKAITLPHMLVATTLALYPIRFLWTWRRRRIESLRKSRGLCPRCAYDLRGISDRCPECGTSSPIAN